MERSGTIRRPWYALAALVLCILAPVMNRPQTGWAAASRITGSTRACIFDHVTLATAPGTCRPRAKAYPPSIGGAVRRAIYDSSLTFGMPYHILLAIGRCESGLNPKASNGHAFGLFQFVPDTFRRAVQQMRISTGVVARNYWTPLDAAYAAGYLFATGQSLSWACEKDYRSAG